MDHIKKLDILRGIAIISVFLVHSQECLYPNYGAVAYNSSHVLDVHDLKSIILNFSPTAFGWSGVNLFLLISGFLLHLGFLSSNKPFRPIDFFSKRFWRIYPPYLLVLLFFCAATNDTGFFFLSIAGLKHILIHLFFAHNLSGSYIYTINPAFWSLALEVQLYILYPVLLLIRKKIGMRNALIGVQLLSFLLLGVGIWLSIEQKLPYNASALRYWFIWCAGAFLAEKYYKREKIFPNNIGTVLLLGIFGTFLSRLFSFGQPFTLYFITYSWLAFFEWFLWTKSVSGKGILAAALSTIGICSYSMYLIHLPYLDDMLKYFIPSARGYLMPLKVIPAFVIIFLVSYSLYAFVELPSIKLGKYLRERNKISPG